MGLTREIPSSRLPGGRNAETRLHLQGLRRIAAADLSDARRLLLVNCVEAYLELNLEEQAEYAQLCRVRENREVRRMATTWSERIAAQGREEGLQAGRQETLEVVKKLLLRLLAQRFAPLPEETRVLVESISSLNRLTRLIERAPTARSLESLRLS